MPSKLRYVMYMPGETLRGSQAVAMLCKMMQKNLFQLELPKTWKKFRTRERLEWLSQFLPSQCKFVMIREPKWTRKNRSRYIKAVHTGQSMNQGFKLTAAQKAAMQHIAQQPQNVVLGG